MKYRKVGFLCIGIVFIACAVAVWKHVESPAVPADAKHEKSLVETGASGSGRPRPVLSKGRNLVDIDSQFFSSGPPALDRKEFTDYLEKAGNLPGAWAAVFDLTNDQGLLKSALERFPGDRRLLRRAALLLTPETDRLAAAVEYSKKFPEESLGDYAVAALEFRTGDTAEALKMMQTALGKSPPVISDNDDIIDRQAALRAVGLNSKEAALRSFNAPANRQSDSGMPGLVRSIAEASLSDEEKGEIGVGLMVHLEHSGPKDAGEELRNLSFEQGFLRHLPEDAEYGTTGQTVGERLSQVGKVTEDAFRALESAPQLWSTATENEVRAWLDAALAGGELFAYRRWLESRK